MTKFIPREKMSRKARRELDAKGRTMWATPPVTRRIENKKRLKDKRLCDRYDGYGTGSFLCGSKIPQDVVVYFA